MFTKRYWVETGERAVKSAAQALIGMWTLDGFNVLTVDWKLAVGVALGGASLSVLTSIASTPFGDHNAPSVV